MTGQMLRHYRIDSKLSEGGMGVVYKAFDTHLDRPVAIKVLRPEAIADPERKRRFVQEAKAASALNHPNIITIYDIDQEQGVDFIAMEFVDGATLERLIPRQGMRLGEVLHYAIQIAGALARAHAAGIIHRDIKPANIMATADGHVKVLDFGLAKLTEVPETDTEVLTAPIKATEATRTAEGTILGSIAYMSPEQAAGRKIDARGDIFSFGSVLYEMVTGRRAFQEDTKISTLAAIMHKEPAALREAAADTPRDLEKIIARCLRKDPARRFQHMDDVKVALEELKEESESGKLAAEIAQPLATSGRKLPPVLLLAAGGAVVIALAAATAWWIGRSKAPPTPSTAGLVRLTSDAGLTTDPALSPDGTLLAYASDRAGEGNLDIWVRQVSGGEAIRLTNDPADDSEPVFSPDGSKIAFRSERDGGGVYVMSALGGEARRIARYGRRPRFSPDGSQIAYTVGDLQPTAGGKSFVVASEGGQPRQIQPDFFQVVAPIWSPDGGRLLFVGLRDQNVLESDWWVAPANGGTPVRTGAFETFRQHRLSVPFLPCLWWAGGSGVILSTRSGDAVNLWQLPISAQTWQVNGALRQITFGAGLEVQPTVAGQRIAFSVLSEKASVWSLPVDANAGKVLGEMARITESGDSDTAPSISADGKKLVFSRGAPRRDLWLKDLASGRERLLAAATANLGQIAPDGSRVVFDKTESQKLALYVTPTGGGEAERICLDCRVPNGLSYDGKKVLYEVLAARAVVLVDAASGQKTEILKHAKYGLSRGRFSPDDRWISFHSITPSARRIFVAPFHGAAEIPENEWIPVTDGQAMDRYACWSPDGNLLYFLSERDSFRCIWAQRLEPVTKHPSGAAFPVRHFHTSRRSLATVGDPLSTGLTVAADKVVFSMTERTGNIWMTSLP
jgi:Tol biopolymer transport system component/tRNA A-37 threonylcarbamoyl transferase component Bud32